MASETVRDGDPGQYRRSEEPARRQTGRETVRENRTQTTRRVYAVASGSTLVLLLASLAAIAIGSVHVPLADVVAALAGGGTPTQRAIVWNLRLPRVLGAVVAGAGLAVAGAAMQTVLRNPLGAPYTLGISQAAAFGAAVAVVLGFGSAASELGSIGPYLTTVAAFLAAMVSTGLILVLVTYRQATPETLILTGVAVGSLFTAGMTLLQYFASDTEVAAIVYWTFGDVGRAGWMHVALMTAVVAAGLAYFLVNAWNYDVMDAGTATAKSLGVPVESLRVRGMAVASLVTAIVISFVGIIGFVGLVAPHVVRMLVGGTERHLLPITAVVGGALLVAADTLARTVLAPVVLPVGILTSFLGAPLFIYLVINGREYW
ncbi:FecCD family ABC transporter permease [Halapricum hydrolyticum]|uniref:Cobalamin import system permease protein BtuC n=1 Tax=Halapricum hydrolyticum TaxID=2979991 RepID=A0AAE3LGX1_9EURY|nr:iron ABC transporter permease [Halapricum hydrolyticum]MCU4718245.1 iron ABC transporter permease [Halapricum hydrolyticum]MCU4726314.1 iron ABC transporter permease [Halapricum hydrolyticum]